MLMKTGKILDKHTTESVDMMSWRKPSTRPYA